jgi:2-(1,2-epoxy-1,2-dihydrophenyl)acetyl-CoA isomerase
MPMASDQQHAAEVTVALGEDFVATVELHRPPDNYFDRALISALADTYQALDADPGCRAIVLCAEGKPRNGRGRDRSR